MARRRGTGRGRRGRRWGVGRTGAAAGRTQGGGTVREGVRRNDEASSGEQALGGHQVGTEVGAGGTGADVACDPLAPQRARTPVPGVEQPGETRAARRPGQCADHGPAGLQLDLHPLYADGGVLRCQLQGGGQFRPGEPARRLLPPQGQQLAVLLVQPAGGLRHLPALS